MRKRGMRRHICMSHSNIVTLYGIGWAASTGPATGPSIA